MSQCYDIACMDCRETLWIAQRGVGGATLYSGDRDTMEKLKAFLFAHAGHHLVFNDDNQFDDFKQLHWACEPDG